jgi:hypothetical protein
LVAVQPTIQSRESQHELNVRFHYSREEMLTKVNKMRLAIHTKAVVVYAADRITQSSQYESSEPQHIERHKMRLAPIISEHSWKLILKASYIFPQ